MNDEKPKLIFVYNAKSGIFNLLSDAAHKIFSPQTYACNLCALTHSNFGMKREWKKFLETLDAPLEFLHADEFRREYRPGEIKLPAIFEVRSGKLDLLIDSETINRLRSVEELKSRLLPALNGAA